MIELAKLLVESAVKLVPSGDILKQRRADEIAQIGLKFFDLYSDVLSVADRGHGILALLATTVAYHREHYAGGVAHGIFRSARNLADALSSQTSALRRLTGSFQRLAPLADIAAATHSRDEFRTLSARLRDKEHHSAMFAEMIDKTLKSRWLAYELEVVRGHHDWRGAKAADVERRILEGLRDRPIEIPWEPTLNRIAEVYLDSGIGARRLDSLTDGAANLRSSFQNVFKLEDILIASERRVRRATD